MIIAAFDFEDTVESAVADVLAAYGINAFTTNEVLDFQKDRPRVQIQATLGPGHLRWADPNTLESIGLHRHNKIETAWSVQLLLDIVTAADEQGKVDQATYRSTVRTAMMILGPQVNGSILTLHKIQLVKESGTARGIHPQSSNSESLQMGYDLELSLNNAVFDGYVRTTVSPSGPSIRITV